MKWVHDIQMWSEAVLSPRWSWPLPAQRDFRVAGRNEPHWRHLQTTWLLQSSVLSVERLHALVMGGFVERFQYGSPARRLQSSLLAPALLRIPAELPFLSADPTLLPVISRLILMISDYLIVWIMGLVQERLGQFWSVSPQQNLRRRRWSTRRLPLSWPQSSLVENQRALLSSLHQGRLLWVFRKEPTLSRGFRLT